MKHVRKSVLLWYSPREMYDLVTDVQAYPQFLPWCSRAEVVEQHEDGVTAKLSMSYMGVQHAFTTRNTHEADKSLAMRLVDGPFSKLEGNWLFQPLGRPGSDQAACKIEFDLAYAFSSVALEAVVSPVFDRVANTLVDSFVRRAEAVYGPPAELRIEVVYCPSPGVNDYTLLQMAEGASVADALQASGVLQRHALLPEGLRLGVWGKAREATSLLRDRDRVEIYRLLTVDPKEARRLRYKRHRDKQDGAEGA